eukprot:7980507-Prorocentrum_lima.AAC.1
MAGSLSNRRPHPSRAPGTCSLCAPWKATTRTYVSLPGLYRDRRSQMQCAGAHPGAGLSDGTSTTRA